ncbi:MAG: hypothetical protein PHT51_04675 [Patescibacteria group bacterium]|nr:hypothetical protein [Patescibacteria group bacterium]MDD4610964.1 hypothetical protein [Patescibacteria group bacterium]
MLDKLFGSNARVKILKQFLLNPEKRFYIRQLSRDLKLQVNSVRRELENLEDFGLLVSNIGRDGEDSPLAKEIEEIKNLKEGKIVERNESEAQQPPSGQEKKYYQVNKDFVLLEELKSLIVKSQLLHEKDFINKLKNSGPIQLLVLSGFFVGKKDSPVDVLIVGKVNKIKLAGVIKELEKEIGRELNFTIMDLSEFRHRRDMTDVFLFHVLEGKKIVIIDELGI